MAFAPVVFDPIFIPIEDKRKRSLAFSLEQIFCTNKRVLIPNFNHEEHEELLDETF